MKRFLLYLLVVATIVACSKSDDVGGGNNNNNETPKQPEITLSTTAADFLTDGGSNVITFTSSEAWTAQVVNSRADDWCSIEPTSGPAGSAKITVTTTENDTPDDRTASIIIKAGTASKTINVSQKQKDALTVTSSKFEISAEGGEVSIEVKANIDFEYAIEESAADWVEYKATRALKTSNLVFEVKENDDTDKREARITITSGEFSEVVTIYQERAEPSIILTENEFAVSSSAETIAVEVKSNVDVTVELPTDADWITENTTRAFSTNTYYFDIEQNDGYDNRTAQIKFTNKATGIYEYVTVTQMQRDAIVVAKDSYTVDSEGDEIGIEVGHNIDFDVEIADDWITRKETRAFVTDKLTFVIAANKGYDNRESTIKFTSKDRGITQTVKVYQAQENALIVSKKDIVVSDEGGDVEFVIQTNVDFTVSKPNVSWLREVTTRGLTSHTLRYEVDPNTSYDSREAKIVVTNRKDNTTETITITQAQKDAIVLAKDSYTVDSEGDEIVIEVGHNIDFDVEIADDWITRKETRAFVTDKLTFVIAANKGYDNRESTIKFTSKDRGITQTVKVYQAQEDALIVSKKDIVVSDEGGDVEFVIQTNVDFTVSKPNVSWLREVTTRGLTSYTLRYEVDPNTSYDSREAKIVVTNRKDNTTETITITQAQKDAIVLAKSEYEIGTEGGALDFELQTNVDLTVTISDNAKSWITQVETRGLETKALFFDIAACAAEEDREGTITIAGGNATQTITVKQSGLKEILEKEREALIAFYNATGGDNWVRNDNWCSDKPVSEWYGVYTWDAEGNEIYYSGHRVATISLGSNNLTGSINKELDVFSELRVLDIPGNNISGSLVLQNEKLRHLGCGQNQLTSIGVSKLTCLERFYCSDNILSTIDVSTNINLLDFQCYNNQIQDLNLGNISKLWQLSCANNPIKEINTINLTNLKNISCQDCLLTELSTEACPDLESICCENNNITNLDIRNNPKLIQLLCGSNPITTLNFSNNPLIETLWLRNCQLKSLDVSNLGNLQVLLCCYNELMNLDISNNTKLNTLWCEGNNISKLDVTNNYKLYSLVCRNELDLYTGEVVYGNNNIPEIDVSSNPELEVLFISGNKLTQLDVTHNTKLRQLELNSNNINHIDLSKNIQLEELYYAFNETTELDVSNNTLLKHLECSRNKITELDLSKNIYLQNLFCSHNDLRKLDISYSPDIRILSCGENPNLTQIYINSTQYFEYWKDDIAEFIYKDGGDPDSPMYYESVDYSTDGVVKQLQTATKGNGIDIVLMGDAYSDRLIADGTYDKVMNTAMEKFFMEEPYKSFRDYFNIYSVVAVSKNEVFTQNSSTAFAGYFGGGTHVGGNDQRVFSYAEKAVGAERMDDALIVVMMNSEAYAGTCYMYDPTDNDDWGDGVSISYFPIGVDDTALAQVLHHEAGGHGFSKLGDEYAYEEMGNVPEWEIESARTMATYGWWKNVDFTNDPAKIKWSHFLSDSRYAGDGLGVYEGAFTYWTGAYRPSWNSIMRYNTGGFNAPSREAIYYRIHKLAYGEDWEYDYEKFVEYDAINRKTAATTRGVPYRLDIPEDFKPLHPPVVMNTSWRNAKNNAPAKNATRSMGGNAGHNLQKSAGTTSHATAKPMTASTSITLPDGTVRTTTISSSGATKVEYKKTNK